uniref:RNA-binding protein Nova-1 n=1 Tax=Cacopsylla melanoneura TaxID=428564 RepID=A0A8D8ZGV5_9HEMI
MWYALQFTDTVMADNHNNNNNNSIIMDTSTSNSSPPPVDSMDSRKRNAESSLENGKTKRSFYGDGVCQIKILVPSYAAGAIIGKGGETIAQIQKDTGSKIKMSKANDFYPGTTDRVCLISGQPDDIKPILKFIMEKIRTRPDMINGDPDRDKQMKVLVPNSTAGMIIGKGGSYVKLLQEKSGSYVQLSQKAKELQERCITVSGNLEGNEKALEMILEKIAEDPTSGSCSNVSYADVNGPVASVNPTGSPFASTPFQQNNYGSPHQSNMGGGPLLSANNGLCPPSSAPINSSANNASSSSGLNFSLNFNNQPTTAVNPTTLAATSQLIEHMKVLIRALGYSDQASAEISGAMATLAKYGILGLGLGTQQALNSFSNPPTPAWSQDPFGGAGGMPQGSTQRALDFPNFRPGSPGGRGFGAAGGEVESKKIEIQVPELIVGAILGPGGRSLNDIMSRSGANVQISKKGVYAPGTRNRVVTIGGSPNAIAHAQILIDRKINDEEWKRNSNNMNTD